MSNIKTRWDESDFENMGWHDAHIHAIAHYTEVLQLRFELVAESKSVSRRKAFTFHCCR